ncbi:MAG: hypothetical protein HQL83_09640 [Magnetococcales bacterium]|nr:hypothetical protein [Magnetococcales bacterium]
MGVEQVAHAGCQAFQPAMRLPFFAKSAKKGKPRRAPAQDPRKNHAGILLRVKGRVKNKIKIKINTLGAIPQTPFFS